MQKLTHLHTAPNYDGVEKMYNLEILKPFEVIMHTVDVAHRMDQHKTTKQNISTNV